MGKRIGRDTKFWLAVICKEILESETLEEAKFNIRSWADVNKLPVERVKVIKSENGTFYSER